MSNYYQILGVSQFAETSEIKRAFRQKAKNLHPDVNSTNGAHKQFQRINEAYQVLKDPEKRRLYDARLVTGFPVQPVYYRPAGKVRYRAKGDKYAHYSSKSEAELKFKAAEQYINWVIFAFLGISGIFAIIYGLYRLLIKPIDNINPYYGLIQGTILLGSVIFYLQYKKKHSK
jgi:hypothetical protein